MLRFLKPDLYVEDITQVSVDFLARKGIQGIIFDLDNTLTEWNRDYIPFNVQNWLWTLIKKKYKLCLVSNNKYGRVSKMAQRMGIKFISKAKKPRRSAFLQAMDLLGTTCETTAVVGDQIFTDVLGGNRLGLYTILVVPLSKREFIGTRLIRHLERIVLKILSIKGANF